MTQSIRDVLQKSGLHLAPAAPDGLYARLIEREGFPLIFGSGLNAAASHGLPDLGFLSLDAMLEYTRLLVSNTNLPVIMDGDTGHGSYLNLYRMIQEFCRAGVAGVQLEDQVFPKRCGHFAGKQVVSLHEMTQRLRMARDAASSDQLYLIARTDALAIEPRDAVLERVAAYVAEGVDAVLVEGAALSHFREVSDLFPDVDLIANIVDSSQNSLIDLQALEESGVRIALFSTRVLTSTLTAAQESLRWLYQGQIRTQHQAFDELQRILGTSTYLERDERAHEEEDERRHVNTF